MKFRAIVICLFYLALCCPRIYAAPTEYLSVDEGGSAGGFEEDSFFDETVSGSSRLHIFLSYLIIFGKCTNKVEYLQLLLAIINFKVAFVLCEGVE